MIGWYHHLNLCHLLCGLLNAFIFGVGMGIGVKVVAVLMEKLL